MEVWREAYKLEADRAELIDAQLKSELDKMGEVSAELLEEFEGCMVDLEPLPQRPVSEAAAEWAEAYLAIRRCNEKSELQLTEMRSKLMAKCDEQRTAYTPSVTQDFGPIRYQGIKFKGITFPRFAAESGSSIFFVELRMPLGLKLEENTLTPGGSGAVRAIEVGDVIEGGSAFGDGRVRPGDYVRCITVPQRRLGQNEELEDEAGGGFDGLGVALGASAGQLTKALLVIPSTSSFPFERVLDEIQRNRELDGYVGLVVERPFA